MPLQLAIMTAPAAAAAIAAVSAAAAATGSDNDEVFRSMKVETTSKTPYSDATQVRKKG